jgi:hypothetical protein
MQGRCSGQQLGDAVDGMVGDAADHLAQIGFGIEAAIRLLALGRKNYLPTARRCW